MSILVGIGIAILIVWGIGHLVMMLIIKLFEAIGDFFKGYRLGNNRAFIGTNDVMKKRPINKKLETNVKIERASQKSVETFIAVLDDTSAQVRIDAVKNLGELGYKRAVGPLLKMLDDRNRNIFIHVVIALSKIGGQKAIKGLVEVLIHKGYEEIMYVMINLIGVVESHVIPLVEVFNGFTEQYKKVILGNLMSQDLDKISNDYIERILNNELKVVLYLKSSKRAEALAIIKNLDNIDKQVELYMYAAEYIKAVELYENANDYDRAGNLYFKLENYEEAERCYQRVNNFKGLEKIYQKTDNKPKLAELNGDYKKAGDLYLKLENYDEAEMCFINAGSAEGLKSFYQKTDNKPKLAELKGDYKRAGDLYFELENYGKAIICYKKVDNLELLEKIYLKTNANLELGKLYERQDKLGLAYQHYLKAFHS